MSVQPKNFPRLDLVTTQLHTHPHSHPLTYPHAHPHSQGRDLVDHIYFYKDGWLADAEENGDLVMEIITKGQHVGACLFGS